MTPKLYSIAILAVAAAAILTAGGASPAAQAPARPAARPNIIWISNEDMSPRLGAYGDALARTPVLDRLARESVRYTHAFTTAPVCAPSRAAIITGMYQTAHRRPAHAHDRGQSARVAGTLPRGCRRSM